MARFASFALVLLLASACSHSPVPGPAIRRDLATAIPAGAIIVAGVDLDQLRTSPLYAKLPPSAAAIVNTAPSAQYLLLDWDGRDVLVLAHGHFPAPPNGATMVTSEIAAFGSGSAMNAAVTQYKAGTTGATALLGIAEPLARDHAAWMVSLGGARLPVSGNGENLNILLRNADFASLALRLKATVAVDGAVLCPSIDVATEVEESLRAFVTLAAAGESRQPDIMAALKAATVQRNKTAVQLNIFASPDVVAKLLPSLGR